jgi:hypothetical protein
MYTIEMTPEGVAHALEDHGLAVANEQRHRVPALDHGVGVMLFGPGLRSYGITPLGVVKTPNPPVVCDRLASSARWFLTLQCKGAA